MTQRKIIHIDMDAFYASVEQRDNPELRGKPLAVGHAEEGESWLLPVMKPGVTVSVPPWLRKRRNVFVPNSFLYTAGWIFINPFPVRYMRFSTNIRISSNLCLWMRLFLDVTENKKDISLAVDIAKEIKQKIREQLNLVASAGISYNKFLAKIASDYRKPDGLCTIHPEQALDFIARLPIESFWGVGPVTAKRCIYLVFTMDFNYGNALLKC